MKTFWRKELLEDEQSEKKKIKDIILEKFKGKLVEDLKKNNGKIEPYDIILQLTKEVDCGTLLDSFNLLQYFEEIKFFKVESTPKEGEDFLLKMTHTQCTHVLTLLRMKT